MLDPAPGKVSPANEETSTTNSNAGGDTSGVATKSVLTGAGLVCVVALGAGVAAYVLRRRRGGRTDGDVGPRPLPLPVEEPDPSDSDENTDTVVIFNPTAREWSVRAGAESPPLSGVGPMVYIAQQPVGGGGPVGEGGITNAAADTAAVWSPLLLLQYCQWCCSFSDLCNALWNPFEDLVCLEVKVRCTRFELVTSCSRSFLFLYYSIWTVELK